MKIFGTLLAGNLGLRNLVRAASRSQFLVKSLSAILMLSTTATATAYLGNHPDAHADSHCETECSDCNPGDYDIPETESECERKPSCAAPDSPSIVWITPELTFPVPTAPDFTVPVIPVITPPAIPVITPPIEVPIVALPTTMPIAPPAVPVITPPAEVPEEAPTTPTEPTAPTSTPPAPSNNGLYPAPVVRVTEEADGVRVSWDAVNSSDFYAYVIVFSETNPNPAYPDDSYYGSITDRNLTSMLVESLYITGGEYYFSVTALYNGRDIAVAGNAVKATMPTTPTPEPQPEGTYPAVTINPLSYDGISMNVSWSKTSDTTGFIGYKVVAAIDDNTPTFPENGCAAFVDKADTTSCSYVINGSFLSGKTYSVTVITVYSVNGVEYNIPSNVQTIQF